MSKVITFSRRFLKGHPRAGAPTYFVEKIAASLSVVTDTDYYPCLYPLREFMALPDFNPREYWGAKPKRHTIRKGHRWKPGDVFSPRFWAGSPYRSKQVAICADVMVKATYDFCIEPSGDMLAYYAANNTPEAALWPLGDANRMFINGVQIDGVTALKLAENDGLLLPDFLAWLPAEFDGQIVCWSDMVEY